MAVQTFFHFKISKMLFSKKKFLLYFLTKKFYATIFFKKFKMADESKWQISLQIFLNALSFFFDFIYVQFFFLLLLTSKITS
jgi:hypothetical protein